LRCCGAHFRWLAEAALLLVSETALPPANRRKPYFLNAHVQVRRCLES
jgi:hypothetical protein